MKKQTILRTTIVVGVIGLLSFTNVQATTVVTALGADQNWPQPGGSGTFPTIWSANFSTVNDVLLGLNPTTVVGDPGGGGNYTTRASVTDGVLVALPAGDHGYGGPWPMLQAAGSGGITELTYTLSQATHLSSIQYYGGWTDDGRASVNFLVSYSTDNGANYTPLIDPTGGFYQTVGAPGPDIQVGGMNNGGTTTFTRHNGGTGPDFSFVNVTDNAGNLGNNALITNLKFDFGGSPTGNGWDGFEQVAAFPAADTVPEPSTFALVGGGLLSLMALRKRKTV